MERQMKRYGIPAAVLAAVIALVYFLFFRPAASTAVYENVLKNGDFTQLGANGLPAVWYPDAYGGLNGTSLDVVQEDGYTAAHIVNQIGKDARFAQDVAVSPNSLYRLHGYIKANAQDGWGATLSIADGYYRTEQIYDSDGQWVEVTLYGRTGENQRGVTVYARLGGYSGESTGEAFIRDVTLCRVDSVPAGFSAINWFKPQEAGAQTAAEASGGTASLLLLAVSAAYALLFAYMLHFLRRPAFGEKETKLLSSPWTAALLLLIALAARLLIAAKIPGYDVDMGCFRAWAGGMTASGPAGFYPPEDPFSYCDYPPGYLWVLWALGGIGKLLGTGVTEFMIKVPPVLADIALCAVLYQAGKKYLSAPAALAVSLLYALNPLTFAAGAAWGQADAVMTLLLLLTVLFAVQGVWKAALPLYMASVFFKPQALMFGPLGLLAFILHIIQRCKEPEKRKAMLTDCGIGLGLAFGVALLIALPFSIHQKADWLITLYSKTMGRYAYATVNSCNLYFLLGKNWVSAETNISAEPMVFLFAVLLTVLPLIGVLLADKKREELLKDPKGKALAVGLGCVSLFTVLFLAVASFAGALTYANLGTVMILHCVLIVCILYIHGHDPRNLPIFGAALLLMLFNVGSMMHERYLFPAVALLLLGYILKKDVRVLWLAVGVTVSGFLNVGCALDRNIRIGGAAGHLNTPIISLKSDTALLEYLSALLNCALCFASVWVCAALSLGDVKEAAEKAAPAEAPQAEAPLPVQAALPKMALRDWLILAVITLGYAVVAFINLGSTKAPQTAFVSQEPGEQIVMDLGESRTFQALCFPGIHYNSAPPDVGEIPSTFTIETSEDGEIWENYFSHSVYNGDCFKWDYVVSSETMTGRYVRLTAQSYNLTLFELLLRDPVTGRGYSAQTIADSTENDTLAFLNDEPDSMEGDYPSWFNSTYFDEIYHARTAYEHLHRLQPYEYTHPPLGKVMMSWAIAIFGMTPFGWRFAGTLAGVLMLPGMYLLGKLLIRRKWGGPAAALLLAFDLMHFTQTRIATIDSFVVLWIIWMVYFMLRWFFLDFFHTPFWKTLIPLALSGLCMGLGVASKWTGCYAGVALAILFFWGVFRRLRLIMAARKTPEEKRTEEERKTARGGKYLLITVASCLIFFILVPLTVYYCSYIPYFAYDGVGVTVDKIIRQTVGTYFIDGNIPIYSMLGYHSQPGLGMNHPFYSPWYEWPIIAKPMYYSSNAYEPRGWQMTIMALGNPAVWWTGLIAMLALAALWAKRHIAKGGGISLYAPKDDPRFAVLLLCYFLQLLPWMLVPRGTYIYHYFPCVPFLILAILLCLDTLADSGRKPLPAGEGEAPKLERWTDAKAERTAFILVCAITGIALILFIAFFPYASGVLTRQGWLDAMKWFDRWLWY